MRLSITIFIVTAVAVAIAALVAVATPGSGNGGKVAAQSQSSQMGTMHQVAASSEGAGSQPSAATVPPATVKLLVKTDEEHAKKGPEGTWHDAYLPASFTVQAGQQVTVHVYNYDEAKHSFTDPGLGLNVTIAAGSENAPKETTFTFTAPTKAGEYEWFCDFPCDPYSMAHKGFMRGDVTVS